jgi:uncharacterized protein YjbI with pentapeptide repeats
MKKIVLFIILTTVLLTFINAFNNNEALDSLAVEDLEKEKLKLEIQKLSQETDKKDFNLIFQFGTLVAALAAAVISIWTASRSQKFQIESLKSQVNQQQKDRISQLLKELGSEHISVKISSVQALSEYESTFGYLINLLKIESDERLISTIRRALKSNIEKSLPILLEETQNVFKSQLRIATSLIAYNNDRKEVAKNLGINNGLLLEWISSREGKRLFSHLTKELSFIENQERNKKCKIETKNLYIKWHKTQFNLTQITDTLEELIVESSLKNQKVHIKNAYLVGITMTGLDLSGWTFKNCNIIDSEFEKCDLRNTKFENIKANNSIIKNCSLQDSIFSDFELKNGNFFGSKGKNVTMTNSYFYNCDFSGANLKSSKYQDCQFKVINLQGSIFSKSVFNGCMFYSCDFVACFFQEAQFVNGKIFQSKFQTAKLIETIFQGTKMFSTNIEKSSFEESNFSFVEWTKIKIINTILTSSTFSSCYFKNVEIDNLSEQTNVNYENCTIK